MTESDRIVGTLGCTYSARQIRGLSIRFCNFSSWSVLPDYRGKGLQLLSAAMKQDGYIFTNFTPNPATVAIFDRLRFKRIDTKRWVMANLPGNTASAIAENDELLSALPQSEAEIYKAHRKLPGVHHLGLRGRDGVNLITFIRSRYHRIPCALIVGASDWPSLAINLTLFRKAALLHFGFLLTAIEQRRIQSKPHGVLAGQIWMPAFYRGEGLHDADIDSLYSEVVTLTPLMR